MRHTGLFRRAATIGSVSSLLTTFMSMPAFAQSATDAAPPMDLSYSTMIAHADTIVQSVMSILAIASIVSWTILVAKSIELTIAGRAAHKACQMAELGMPDTGADAPAILTMMRGAIRSELAASIGAGAHGTKDRLASRLRRIELRVGRQAQRGTGILATIGAVGPFVGLFGTVWGIMNSFIGIARLHTTNLSVVAPGIAEALLATAMGLVAAIPAVIIYNIFSRWLGGYRATLADLSEVIVRHASRALDMDDEIQRTAPNPAYRLANAE